MTKIFGEVNGETAHLYEISGKNGMKAEITDFGASLVTLLVPDKNNQLIDVVTGYDSAEDYAEGTCYFGATVGRNANRIAGAKVTIGGRGYLLEANDNENNLHSGSKTAAYKIWDMKEICENCVTFSTVLADLEDGFPGTMKVEVTYLINDQNGLEIQYHAVSDADTICNFTNHSYFNLNGHGSGDVLGHGLYVNASYYTPVHDSKAIPTGELAEVAETPFDFKTEKKIGRDIAADFEQLKYGGGYDHNFVLDTYGKNGNACAARVCGDKSGICMEVYTDLPGMQLYTANFVDGVKGKSQMSYGKRCALCLETQYFPNAANETKFESPLLKAGEEYNTVTCYRFYSE